VPVKGQKLTIEELCLVLSHRKIGVSSEDEVISAVIEWLRINVGKVPDEKLVQLASSINWPYVSFDKLLEIFRTFPELRRIQQTKTIFFSQI